MPKKKNKATETTKPEATPQPSESTVIDATPGALLSMAMGEEVRRELADYGEVINVLRNEKNFTFREIASWLRDHGINTDHNAVYREYTRGMPPADADAEVHADMATEREEQGF